jgi:spore germination protein
VLSEGIMPVLKGIAPTTFAFLGTYSMLIFTAFMCDPDKAMKSALIGVSLVIPLYVLIVVISIGTLTVEGVQTLTFPMMDVVTSIEVPGGLFERFESLFITIWVLAIYTSVVPGYFIASLGLGELFRKDQRYFVYGLLPVIFFIAMYPPNLNALFTFGEYIGYTGAFISIIVPSYFLIIAKIRRKGHA